MTRLLIAGGRVLDSRTGTTRVADLGVSDGRIAEIGPSLPRSPADRVIDAQGLLVCPGLIDPHVHLREPGQEHKETLRSGTRAGVSGGFTTLCCMPNTQPAIDTPELIHAVAARAAATAAARVFCVAAATKGRKGDEIAEIGLMTEAGAVGFSDDGDCIASAGMMSRVLAACRQAGRPFMQHAQEPTLTSGAVMHAGEVSVRLGLTGWPRVAEELIVERDIRLNRAIGAHYHVQHVSSGGTVEIVRRARREGQPVTCEVTPHHLLLTHEACAGADGHSFNTAAKMNPPLREQSDIEALREGVADGTITVLGTDHAPHSADEKALDFDTAPFGIIGLETALALYAQALVEPGVIGWERLIQLMTIEPARLCGLDALGLGTLEAGGPGDVTVIDPGLEWTVSAADLVGQSRNTPFLGRRVKGRSVLTVVSGEVRHERARA
jgi:dihydroorotase